jgi:hypothetical protein
VLKRPQRPTIVGRAGGRAYIGPKAQSTVHETFFDRAAIEATDRRIAMTDVWREVIYAGLLRTGRATRAEVREACVLVGIDPAKVLGEA